MYFCFYVNTKPKKSKNKTVTIDKRNGYRIPANDEPIQYRRAEKGWRHRDNQRAWTQHIWNMLVTSQSILLGIFAIIATRPDTTVTSCQLAIVTFITVVELGVFMFISSRIRDVEKLYAEHFESLVSSGENQSGYDDTGKNNTCKEKRTWCDITTKKFEYFGYTSFLTTISMLIYVILH